MQQGREPIPEGHVIPVMWAMQGPESPRLWGNAGIWQGEKCYFTRQVDDFKFAAPSMKLAHSFYDAIDDHLSLPIKQQGMVTLFNGIDIQQLRHYIKISAETNIEKMGAKYLELWHGEVPLMAELPLPIPTHKTFIKSFNNAVWDNEPDTQKTLQQQYNFGYRNGVGEPIYAMVTCHPGISTVTVKCAQHSANPAKIHFQAIKHDIKYLVTTS
ncbi:hypothetical protein ACHAW6_000511 [Cyclotella cf. meneghiniana]